jgi:hypothetical protein
VVEEAEAVETGGCVNYCGGADGGSGGDGGVNSCVAAMMVNGGGVRLFLTASGGGILYIPCTGPW